MTDSTHNVAYDTSTITTKGYQAVKAVQIYISDWWYALLAHPRLHDINAGYAAPLRYAYLDSLAVKFMWTNGIVVLAILLLNTYFNLPAIYPSILGRESLSMSQALLCMAIGGVALALPLVSRTRIDNHFVWRIILTLSLATYTYLLIFVTGGSGVMYFHMVLVLVFMAMYADWRLEWLAAIIYIVSQTITWLVNGPGGMYSYGTTWLSAPLLIVFLLILTYICAAYCRNYRQSIDDLLESMRRNDHFLAVASHELRTPLTSMKGYTEVLERRLKRSSQTDLLGYATKLDDQLSRMTSMVRDLLDVSKMQSGQMTLRSERLSVNTLVGTAVEEVQALAHHHKVIVSGWVNTPVMGDAIRLNQVLVNVLANAMKYSPTSDKVKVALVEHRDTVVINIRDYGMGIPIKEQAQIFEPYYRSQNALRADVPGGLGMGLYISSEIIQRHGGRIWLESQEGKGSTFSIMLPLAKPGLRVDKLEDIDRDS